MRRTTALSVMYHIRGAVTSLDIFQASTYAKRLEYLFVWACGSEMWDRYTWDIAKYKSDEVPIAKAAIDFIFLEENRFPISALQNRDNDIKAREELRQKLLRSGALLPRTYAVRGSKSACDIIYHTLLKKQSLSTTDLVLSGASFQELSKVSPSRSRTEELAALFKEYNSFMGNSDPSYCYEKLLLQKRLEKHATDSIVRTTGVVTEGDAFLQSLIVKRDPRFQAFDNSDFPFFCEKEGDFPVYRTKETEVQSVRKRTRLPSPERKAELAKLREELDEATRERDVRE
jgi:hypothetical protein